MPFPRNVSKRGALLAEVAIPELAGVNVFDRGSSVTLDGNTYRYLDLVALLLGYGSQTGRSIAEDFETQWSIFQPGVNIRTGMLATDRFYIEVEDATGGPWTLTTSGNNSTFGAPSETTNSTLVDGWHRIEFPDDWSREQPVNKHLQFKATISGTERTFDVPSVPYKAQSILTLFREVGTVGDLDDQWASTCVETLDNTANDTGGGNRRIRWGIDEHGDVWTAYPTSAGIAAPTFTQAGDGFRKLLGAGADATPSSEDINGDFGSVTVVTYRHFGEPVKAFTRPIRLRERTSEETDAWDGRDHGIAYGRKIPKRLWQVLGYLDGPGDRRARHRHFHRYFLPRAHKGALVSVVKGWPCELRRAADPRDQAEAYTLSTTTEGYHDVGRIVCRRATEDNDDRQQSWRDGLRKRGSFQMVLKEAEDGV